MCSLLFFDNARGKKTNTHIEERIYICFLDNTLSDFSFFGRRETYREREKEIILTREREKDVVSCY